MARGVLDEIFDEVVTATGASVKPCGFMQRGLVLRKIAENNCGIIEFQRSTKSTPGQLFFTVNLGVICGELLEAGPSAIAKARIIDAHVRQRVGMFLPGRPDKWWEITESTDRASLAQELVTLILKEAVSFIEHYLSTSAVIALWESEQSPGLTDGQRVRLLSKLKAKSEGGRA